MSSLFRPLLRSYSTKFNWEDALNISSLLTQEEKLLRDSVKSFCDAVLHPKIIEDFRHETSDVRAIYAEFGRLGILGCTLRGWVLVNWLRMRKIDCVCNWLRTLTGWFVLEKAAFHLSRPPLFDFGKWATKTSVGTLSLNKFNPFYL